MGLYISHMRTVLINEERSLYIYLLDYGWPSGEWETLFKKHFMQMADRASQTGAIVIGSMNGIHFGNEVLSWHGVGGLNANQVLPGLLLTKTHPNYFTETYDKSKAAELGIEDLLVIPLKPFCKDETDFLSAIEGIFADLTSGLDLKNFEIAKHDPRLRREDGIVNKVVNAISVKPGAFGVSVDLKALLFPKNLGHSS